MSVPTEPKKRILLVSPVFEPEVFKVNDLAKEWHALGYEVDVITGLPNYNTGEFSEGYSLFKGPYKDDLSFACVYRFPVFPRKNGRFFYLFLNYLTFVLGSLFFSVPRVLKNSYDLVFIFASSPITIAIPAVIVSKLKKIPLYIWVQDIWPETVSAIGAINNKFMIHLIGQLVKWVYKACDKIFIQSRSFSRSVLKWGGESSKIIYFPNWAEEMFEAPSFLEIKNKEDKNKKFTLLFAGNLGHAQALPTLLEAADQLKEDKDIEWHIYGDGALESWLKEEIIKRGIENQFVLHGRHPIEKMPKVYSQHSALIVSLKKSPILEMVLPSKVQSYMASAKPIIASGGGELYRLVKSIKCGFSSSSEDVIGLVTNILRLKGMNELEREKMGEKGYKYYKDHFVKKDLIHQLEVQIQETLNKRAS